MAKIKFGRYELDIDENDIILDNEACYQIITKEVRSGWESYHPKISKKMFGELKICGIVITSEELRQKACKKYLSDHVTYWKFNMEIVDKFYN